ncbi:MAG TPA: YHS domain-containing (seleno)protein [Rhabdaerophilum sp.]|nr:YHS domain-containing (seleno)protein [Rhabdaerophilum sp.]
MNTDRRFLFRAAMTFAVVAGLSGAVFAKEPAYFTGIVSGVGAGGYDTVAYFTDKRAMKGDPALSVRHDGVEWRFSSAANRDAFVASPAKFIPQFGGYCSYAVAKGGTASGDPTQWDIVDGKLYFNYDADIRKTWNADRENFIKAGHANWPKVLGR